MRDERIELIGEDLVYMNCGADLQEIIIEVIQRLPDDVADFALDDCQFISVQGAVTIDPDYFRSSCKGRWTIIFNEDLHSEDIHSTLAHEIAHAWLGHKTGFTENEDEPEKRECEARNLARQWGFTGHGAGIEP